MHKRPRRREGRACAALLPRLRLLTQSIPFGQRPPSSMLESHSTYFCAFVLLPFAKSNTFAKRGKNKNGYTRSTKTHGTQHLRRFERAQTERRRVEVEYNNVRGMPSRTVQTNTNGVQTSTNGIHTNTNRIQQPREKQYLGRY